MANISTPTERYTELKKKRFLPRTLWNGTIACREARQSLTPKHPMEESEAYQVRLDSTYLYNGLTKTIKAMVGKIYSHDVILNPDVPARIKEALDNMDGQGRNVTNFLYDVSQDDLIDGVAFVFVEMPTTGQIREGSTLVTGLDIIDLKIRPYTILITADQLIGFKSENQFGNQVLTETRWEEYVTIIDPSDPYIEKQIKQIRKLTPGRFEVWRKYDKPKSDGTENWYIFEEGDTGINYIPVVPFYANRVAFMEGEPPLMPLAELNQAHWISTSEQNKALTYARFAMLTAVGISKEEMGTLKVGPDQVLSSEMSDAKFGYVETSGAALAAGAADIDLKERQMEHAGMSIRVKSVRGTTATEATIGSSEADAALIAFTMATQDSMNIVLDMIADRMGIVDGGTVEINKLFVARQPTGTMTEMLQSWKEGGITQEEYLEEGIRRDYFRDDLDITKTVTDTKEKQLELALAVQAKLQPPPTEPV